MVLNHIFFFFNDTATTEIYTLSLHDALPICSFDVTRGIPFHRFAAVRIRGALLDELRGQDWASRSVRARARRSAAARQRSEEHTSELQSRQYLVCRLLLEKKKKYILHRLLAK